MTAAAALAALAVAFNAGVSRAARVWTKGREDRWGKAQFVSALVRFAVVAAGSWAAWTWTRRPGALVLYIFAAALGQMVLHIYLLEKNKI